MRIGELAQSTSTPIETIRYYERAGLLRGPARSKGNYRVYDETYAERLTFIRHCRSLDMALDEIRVLLRFKDAPAENCDEVNALLDEHIGHVAARIRELRTLERQLKTLRAQCLGSQQSARCGILNELAGPTRLTSTAAARGRAHVAGVHGKPRGQRSAQ